MSNNEINKNYTNRKCQCCGRDIYSAESVYSIEISKDFSQEILLTSVCVDCYSRFMQIINNAKRWRESNV